MAATAMTSPYRTRREVARRFNVSEKTVYNLTRAGKLKATTISSRCVRYHVQDVDAYEAAQQK